jgi:hypothetical protein
MSYLLATPEFLASAATDLAGIGSAVSAANGLAEPAETPQGAGPMRLAVGAGPVGLVARRS